MARGRMLSRTLGSSRRFHAVTALANGAGEFAQLLFTLLIPHADDFGRMVGDAFTVKLQVFPASDRTVAEFTAALAALNAADLIALYQVGDAIWLQVNKFEEHQRGLAHRTASRIPPPSEAACRNFSQMGEIIPSRARAEVELKLTKENKNKHARSVGAGEGGTGGTREIHTAAVVTDARSRRPIYQSDRFVVFEWMLDDLGRLLGPHTDAFDLHTFFDALTQQSRDSGLVIPQRDKGAWLQAQVLAEAVRRGLPIAVGETPERLGKGTKRLLNAIATFKGDR